MFGGGGKKLYVTEQREAVNQNMEKGGSELTRVLKELTTVSWEEKRSRVKVKAASVGTKLMFPSMIMFIAIIMMVVVPAIGNSLM